MQLHWITFLIVLCLLDHRCCPSDSIHGLSIYCANQRCSILLHLLIALLLLQIDAKTKVCERTAFEVHAVGQEQTAIRCRVSSVPALLPACVVEIRFQSHSLPVSPSTRESQFSAEKCVDSFVSSWVSVLFFSHIFKPAAFRRAAGLVQSQWCCPALCLWTVGLPGVVD